MNKTEMIKEIAERTELTKADSAKVLEAFQDIVKEKLASGDKVQLVGFGTFETVERAGREGRNPRTGESMYIEKSISPKFKPSNAFKEAVRK